MEKYIKLTDSRQVLQRHRYLGIHCFLMPLCTAVGVGSESGLPVNLVILYVFEKLGEFAADKRKEILSMCVGLSAKVVKINDGVAIIDAGGAKREISSQLIEDLEPGDYVMVHAGVAIAKITDEDDSETDQVLEDLF